jgi:uncharacterized membrane protein YfcA
MLGMASGIFVVPILTTFGHIDIRTAIGASIVSVIACSCASAAPFLKGGLVNLRLAVVLETTTTLGALTGVLLVGIIPTAYLFMLFALILALSAQQFQLVSLDRFVAHSEGPPSLMPKALRAICSASATSTRRKAGEATRLGRPRECVRR